MNILLTDLRTPILETQEIPALDATPAGGFSRLLRQQLSSVFDGSQQVIELKGEFIEIPGFEMNPGIVSEATPEAGWREYLAQQQSAVGVDADRLALASGESDETPSRLPAQSAPGTPVAPVLATAAGESLPAGGNSLPDAAPPPPVTPAATLDMAGFDSAEPLPGNTALTPSPEPPQQAKAPETAGPDMAPAGINPPPAGKPAEPAQQTAQPSRAAPEPGRVTADIGTGGESVVARDPSRRQPSPATSGVTALPLAAEAARLVVDPDPQRLPERIVPGGITLAESGSTQRPAAPHGADGLAEKSPMTDPRDAFKLPQAMQKPVSETPVGDAMSGRAAELPAQAAANNAQQSATGAQPLPHGPAVPGAATPAAQLAGLPGPLDAMNISRNADSSDWGNGLGERVSWMINQKQNIATIRLDPPSLGKLDVHVRVADDATTITIQTQHAQTRDLIESAALRLRDYLQESGYQNVNVDVSQRQDQQHAQSRGQDAHADPVDEPGPDPVPDPAQSPPDGFMNGEGLVDTFA